MADPKSKPVRAEGKFRRDAGLFGLVFANVGGVIGSGWMFAPLQAAKAAGPAALLAWLIGGAAILSVALVYAELSTSFPRAGAVIAFPKLSHGPLLATIMSWFVVLGYAASAPAEAAAVVTYGANYMPGLIDGSGHLSWTGFLAGSSLLGLFAALNLLAIRVVLHINAAITICKIAIPALTIAAFVLGSSFHPANFHALGFAPHGADGVFAALATSGVIYAYTGFDEAIELAGESRNPVRDLPLAIIGSVVIGFLIYAGVQAALIGALAPADLANGWGGVRFPGASGPFAGLAALAGMHWLAALLYADSVVSPSGTAIVLFAATPRLLFAVGREGLSRARLERLSLAGAPVVGVALTWFAGVLFLLPLPSWTAIVKVVSASALLSYAMTCVSMLALRRTAPVAEHSRPWRLRFGAPIAAAAFVVTNFIVVWTGPGTVDLVFALIVVATLVHVALEASRRALRRVQWRGAWWLAPYLGGLSLFAHAGAASAGGRGLYSLGFGVGLGLFSLAALALALACALPDPEEAKASLAEARGA